jgi:hypothetical protein
MYVMFEGTISMMSIAIMETIRARRMKMKGRNVSHGPVVVLHGYEAGEQRRAWMTANDHFPRTARTAPQLVSRLIGTSKGTVLATTK